VIAGSPRHLEHVIPGREVVSFIPIAIFLEENLVRQLRRWAPYAGGFGLLLVALHAIPPQLAAANPDATPG
jgi:hypothetical protein